MKKPPEYYDLRIMGCLCYAASKTTDKLSPRSRKCIFLGYPYATNGYKFYDMDTHQIFLAEM